MNYIKNKTSILSKSLNAAVTTYRNEKAGKRTQVARTLPILDIGYCSIDAMEYGILRSYDPNTWSVWKEAFGELPEETKCLLCFSPEDGTLCDRATLCRSMLKDALPSAQYHGAMTAILDHYIKIKIHRTLSSVSDDV